MKSVKDPAAVIGLQGQLRTVEGLRVDVGVGDARKAYRRIDYRLSPVWVASDRVELESKA